MANLGGVFNANAVAPATGEFRVVAPGVYPAMITDSEIVNTSSGTGRMLKLDFEICDGPEKGARITERLNLWNPSAQAVEIAQKQFSAICHAVMNEQERDNVSDSSQLHNRPMEITVGVETFEKRDGSGTGNSNKITKYARLGTAAGGAATSNHPAPGGFAQPAAHPAAQPAQQPAQGGFQQPAAGTGKPAWAK